MAQLRFDRNGPRYNHSTAMRYDRMPYLLWTAALAANKLCGRPPQYSPAPCKLTFDVLTSKVVSESHVTWPTSVPILVFLGLSVLDLGPMYATDRRHRLMPPRGGA